MKFDDVILGRRSIRGYKRDPVPRALIGEIMALAMRAPSSLNTQPWNFYVVAGAPLDRIRAGNTERNLAGVPSLARVPQSRRVFAGAHRERQIGIAKQLFAAMGIARHDKEGRQDWVLRGFRQFDAPVSRVVTYDRDRSTAATIAPFDCGAVTNALVNAAWSRGLGCRDQQPGDHAVAGRSRARGDRRRSGDHDLRRHGLAGRDFPANAVVSRAQVRRRCDHLCGIWWVKPGRNNTKGPVRDGSTQSAHHDKETWPVCPLRATSGYRGYANVDRYRRRRLSCPAAVAARLDFRSAHKNVAPEGLGWSSVFS